MNNRDKILNRIIGIVDNSITLSIPEFNYRVSFKSKLVLDKNTIVRIHGFCNPINPEIGASLEEYFEVKDVRIKK